MVASLVGALSVCIGVGKDEGGSMEDSSVRLMYVMVIGGVRVATGAMLILWTVVLLLMFG